MLWDWVLGAGPATKARAFHYAPLLPLVLGCEKALQSLVGIDDREYLVYSEEGSD